MLVYFKGVDHWSSHYIFCVRSGNLCAACVELMEKLSSSNMLQAWIGKEVDWMHLDLANRICNCNYPAFEIKELFLRVVFSNWIFDFPASSWPTYSVLLPNSSPCVEPTQLNIFFNCIWLRFLSKLHKRSFLGAVTGSSRHWEDYKYTVPCSCLTRWCLQGACTGAECIRWQVQKGLDAAFAYMPEFHLQKLCVCVHSFCVALRKEVIDCFQAICGNLINKCPECLFSEIGICFSQSLSTGSWA